MIDQIRADQQTSVRRNCVVLGFTCQTYYKRKQGHRPEEVDQEIADLLHRITKRFVAWGFWMVFHYLRKQGYLWNHKKIYRIWKQEQLNLRLPPKRSKIKRKYQDLLAPKKVNEGWAVDFVSDWIVGPGGKRVRIINVMPACRQGRDECSRKALWKEAYSSISAKPLIELLNKIVAWKGKPLYIRYDNGPEFISAKLALWAAENEIEPKFIQPGKPSQNGLIERLNGTLRTECLNLEWFKGIPQLNEQIQQWWMIYDTIRPHSSISYKTPDEFELELSDKFYLKTVAA